MNVRSAEGDLTARARIRDEAIGQFSARGFGVSIRVIAEAAGVSAGLVIHHFGSKEGLRRACDDHVLRLIRERETEVLQEGRRPDILRELARLDEWTPLIGYLMRTLLAGGPLARTFFEQMVTDAEDYLETGVRAGAIRPSRDPAARARYLVQQSVGGALLHLALTSGPNEAPDFSALMQDLVDTETLPALEVMTEGLLIDRTPLEDLRRYQAGLPGAPAPVGAGSTVSQTIQEGRTP